MLEDYDFPISISLEELDKDVLKFEVSHTRVAGAERMMGGLVVTSKPKGGFCSSSMIKCFVAPVRFV